MAGQSLNGLRFLVVDDDSAGLDMIKMLLTREGATVLQAKNGASGLEITRSEKPDIVITDLSMPVMNGWDMIAELKGDPETASIPVIALTAHAMTDQRQRAIDAGCDDYLTKPINPYGFIASLNAMLNTIFANPSPDDEQ